MDNGRPILPAFVLVCVLVVLSLLGNRTAPGSPAFLYEAGEKALASQEWDVACDRFVALAARYPDYRDVNDKLNQARYRAGMACLECGAYERAVAELRSETRR